jgi:hypothetical protein
LVKSIDVAGLSINLLGPSANHIIIHLEASNGCCHDDQRDGIKPKGGI